MKTFAAISYRVLFIFLFWVIGYCIMELNAPVDSGLVCDIPVIVLALIASLYTNAGGTAWTHSL